MEKPIMGGVMALLGAEQQALAESVERHVLEGLTAYFKANPQANVTMKDLEIIGFLAIDKAVARLRESAVKRRP